MTHDSCLLTFGIFETYFVTCSYSRYVYNFFREHGLNPTQEEVNEFYASHRDAFSCKSAAYLTIREVKQKIIKLQLM